MAKKNKAKIDNASIRPLLKIKSLLHLFTLKARVAPVSDNVIGGMLASECAISLRNRTYILKDSLFAIYCLCKVNFIWRQWVEPRRSMPDSARSSRIKFKTTLFLPTLP